MNGLNIDNSSNDCLRSQLRIARIINQKNEKLHSAVDIVRNVTRKARPMARSNNRIGFSPDRPVVPVLFARATSRTDVTQARLHLISPLQYAGLFARRRLRSFTWRASIARLVQVLYRAIREWNAVDTRRSCPTNKAKVSAPLPLPPMRERSHAQTFTPRCRGDGSDPR